MFNVGDRFEFLKDFRNRDETVYAAGAVVEVIRSGYDERWPEEWVKDGAIFHPSTFEQWLEEGRIAPTTKPPNDGVEGRVNLLDPPTPPLDEELIRKLIKETDDSDVR